jgi:hypothetical protein
MTNYYVQPNQPVMTVWGFDHADEDELGDMVDALFPARTASTD